MLSVRKSTTQRMQGRTALALVLTAYNGRPGTAESGAGPEGPAGLRAHRPRVHTAGPLPRERRPGLGGGPGSSPLRVTAQAQPYRDMG